MTKIINKIKELKETIEEIIETERITISVKKQVYKCLKAYQKKYDLHWFSKIWYGVFGSDDETIMYLKICRKNKNGEEYNVELYKVYDELEFDEQANEEES